LVVRREIQAPDRIKYSVSKAAPEVLIRTLASAQSQRRGAGGEGGAEFQPPDTCNLPSAVAGVLR